jgi:hypothetical protein
LFLHGSTKITGLPFVVRFLPLNSAKHDRWLFIIVFFEIAAATTMKWETLTSANMTKKQSLFTTVVF